MIVNLFFLLDRDKKNPLPLTNEGQGVLAAIGVIHVQKLIVSA